MRGSTRVLYPGYPDGGVAGLSRLWLNVNHMRGKKAIGMTETGDLVRTKGLRSQEQIGERVYEYKAPNVHVVATQDVETGAVSLDVQSPFNASRIKPARQAHEVELEQSGLPDMLREVVAQTISRGGTSRDSGELWSLEVYKVFDAAEAKARLKAPDDNGPLTEQYGGYIVATTRFNYTPSGPTKSVHIHSYDQEGQYHMGVNTGSQLTNMRNRETRGACLERPYRPERFRM
jgi:hypothetical protein